MSVAGHGSQPEESTPDKYGDLNPRSTLGLLTRAQAAAAPGVAEDTLKKWGVLRKGPASIKVGGRRYYKLAAIRKWVDDQETGW